MKTHELIVLLIFLATIIIVYASELALLLDFILVKLKGVGKPKLFSKPAIILHIFALIGIICFLYGYFIEPYWIEINTINIYTEKLKNTTLKVVHISDLHCDKKIRNENKLPDIINPLKPDIIVFTGDTLNTPKALDTFKDVMKKIKAKIGKYAVRGNFDDWFWKKLDLFSNTGFKVLDKDKVKLVKDNETFYISGEVLEDIPKNNYSILLYHYPDLIEDLKKFNVDLYLTGHTHGGQVALPFYGAFITLSEHGKKYESGKYVVGDTILYINRGIGLEPALKVRFFARPEITVFNIMPKNEIPK